MKTYNVIIFDLFDTVVNFNRSRLPAKEINGYEVKSTSVLVYEVFKRFYDHVSFNDFYTAFLKSYEELEELKRKENIEIHNKERFKLMLTKLNIKPKPGSNRLLEEMVLCHMQSIADAMEFPKENRDTLNLLRNKYRLALISNFDHAPTAYSILDRFNIKGFFERILISIEIGWRKPKAYIFLKAFNLLKTKPDEAIFVGDNLEADVVGSKSVGMKVIWINKNNEEISKGIPNPDYEVTKLIDIGKII
ncbi:MAG: HAD family hydrolase [Candidatus Dadabacteria bacterium]|nr:HAD family hydrolase [Candidatus Dadabacteria bacterium]